MAIERLVTMPEYWKVPAKNRPRALSGLLKLIRKSHPSATLQGLWEVREVESATGKTRRIVWGYNVITDKGAQYALENLFNPTSGANPVFQYMAITTNAGSTYTTGAIAITTPITSIPVAAIPAPIASGIQCTVDYGGTTPEIVTLSAPASLNATSLTINSWGPTAAHVTNRPVVPLPVSSDNPTTLGGTVAYQTLVAGDYVNSIGVGSGNRQRTISKKFLGASTAAGLYTEAWMTNTNPVALAGQVAAHIIVPQASIAVGIDQIFTFIVKL